MSISIQPLYTAFEYVDKTKKVVKINNIIDDAYIDVNGEKQNVICHILASSLPFEFREEFIKNFHIDTYHKTFREKLVEVEAAIANKALIEGLHLKFRKGSPAYDHLQNMTQGGTKITYKDNELYGNILSQLAAPRMIEKEYHNAEDLVYDIYRAGTILKFFCIYLPGVFQHLDKMTYLDIIGLFETLKVDDYYQFITRYMYNDAKELILSKELFFKVIEDKEYDFVKMELENPYNLYNNIYNMTLEYRVQRLDQLKNIYLVFAFIQHNVVPKYQQTIYSDDHKDLFINRFQDYFDPLSAAEENMREQLQDVKMRMMNIENLSSNDLYVKYYTTILDLCNKLESCSPEIFKTASKWTEPLQKLADNLHPLPLRHLREPIDLRSLGKRVKRIDIKPNSVLSPESNEFPFSDAENMFLFPSIEFYKIFKLGTEFLGIPSVEFYFELVNTAEKKFKTLEECKLIYETALQVTIKNRVAQNSMFALDQWVKNPVNAQKLAQTAGKNIVLYSNNVFIGQRVSDKHGVDFIGKYLTMLRDGLDILITDEFIIQWFRDKVEDMNNALTLYNIDHSNVSDVINFLQTAFAFSPKPVRISIEGVEQKTIVEKYVSQFIGTVFLFAVTTEADFKKYVLDLQNTEPKPLDDPKMYLQYINLMCKTISQKKDVQEMNRLLKMICKYRDVEEIKTDKDVIKFFQSHMDDKLIMNRFLFFRNNLVLKS